MHYKLVTPAEGIAVSLDEAKQHLRIAHAEQDAEITSLINAATLRFEKDTGMVLLNSEWCLLFDVMPNFSAQHNSHIQIWKAPISDITKVEYYTPGTEALQTLAADKYIKDNEGIPARVYVSEVPDIDSDRFNAVRVTFTAGYADSTKVPDLIKSALKLLIAHYYENPSHVVTGTIATLLPDGYNEIANSFKTKLV